MGNMSYCRFRNTLPDLVDCKDALDSNEETEDASEERAKQELIRTCCEIAEDYGHLVGYDSQDYDDDQDDISDTYDRINNRSE